MVHDVGAGGLSLRQGTSPRGTTASPPTLDDTSAFSEPANYQAFVDAVGFIPTQPGATLNTAIGAAVAPFLANFRVGYEQYWVAPRGAGEYANPFASYFKPFGTFDDAQALANKVQADLQSGLDANQ